jgi:hypothetical protein
MNMIMPDLNAWLDFFKDKKTSKYRLKMLDAFHYDKVCTTGIIITQLLGSMPMAHVEEIKNAITGVKFVEFSIGDYFYSGELSAFMAENNKEAVTSSLLLHVRYCEVMEVEFLSSLYKDKQSLIDETVIEYKKYTGKYVDFIYKSKTGKLYKGDGYLDKDRADRLNISSDTIFSNSECEFDYIPVKDRKPMQVSESSDYTLYKKEGQVSVV